MNLFMGNTSEQNSAPPLLASGLCSEVYPIAFIFGALDSARAKLETARLIRLAEICNGRRDYSTLEHIAHFLMSVDQDAGLFYSAIVANHTGNQAEARALFEALARYASPIIRTRAQLALGAAHHRIGDRDGANSEYLQAARNSYGVDALTLCTTLFQMSLLKSQSGNHQDALDDLEQAWPIVRLISKQHPYLFYWFHNDLAFELAQIGRIQQAQEHSCIAANSPLIESYPEWRETPEQIKKVERKVLIVVRQKAQQVNKPKPVLLAIFYSDFRLAKIPQSYLCKARHRPRAPSSILDRIKVCMRTRDRPCL